MMATKDQERKALAQIKKIVDGLGTDSYVGEAFKGCFKIAEENIDSDFFDSMMGQRDRAIAKGEETGKALLQYSEKIERLKNENEKLKGDVDRAKEWVAESNKRLNEMVEKGAEKQHTIQERENRVKELEQEIINLKAKLYDMMVAQGA